MPLLSNNTIKIMTSSHQTLITSITKTTNLACRLNRIFLVYYYYYYYY